MMCVYMCMCVVVCVHMCMHVCMSACAVFACGYRYSIAVCSNRRTFRRTHVQLIIMLAHI